MKFKMVPKPLLWLLAFLSAVTLDGQAAEPGIMTEEDDPAIVLDVNFPAFKTRNVREWANDTCRFFGGDRARLEKICELGNDPGGVLQVTALPGASLYFCCGLSRADDDVASGLQFEIAAACPSAVSLTVTLRLNGHTESLIARFQSEEGKACVSRSFDVGSGSAKPFAKEFSFDPISFDEAQMGKKNLVLKLADWKRFGAHWGGRQLFALDLDDPVHNVGALYLATDKELLVQRIAVHRLN